MKKLLDILFYFFFLLNKKIIKRKTNWDAYSSAVVQVGALMSCFIVMIFSILLLIFKLNPFKIVSENRTFFYLFWVFFIIMIYLYFYKPLPLFKEKKDINEIEKQYNYFTKTQKFFIYILFFILLLSPFIIIVLRYSYP